MRRERGIWRVIDLPELGIWRVIDLPELGGGRFIECGRVGRGGGACRVLGRQQRLCLVAPWPGAGRLARSSDPERGDNALPASLASRDQ
jgi:hypothetical protein